MPVAAALFTFSILLFSQFAGTAVAASSPASRSSATHQAVALSQSMFLRWGDYQGFEVDSFSANTTVDYASSSRLSISVALMTAVQYNAWQNRPSDPISNSITDTNGTSIQNSVPVPPGQYFILFYAYLMGTAVNFGFQVYPSTPFSYGQLSTPLAVGIASFGVANSSGTVSSYQIQTSQVVGLARISSFQVNTPDASRYGTNVAGATVQLNTMLVVNDSGKIGPQKVYWVQNVPDFVTSASAVSIDDEIWNNTDNAGFLSNQTITSVNFANGGFVYTSGTGRFSTGPNLYDYNTANVTYRLPLSFALMMKASVIPKSGVLVQEGYRILSNGSAGVSTAHWYDNVTIHDAAATATYFEISGSASTPTGHFYDAEMVLCGEGNLESAHFTQLNATLGLFYQNANGILSSFPTYYGFSGDTGEAADNLAVAYANGMAQLTTSSNPNYPYLGSASLALDPNSLIVSPSGQTTTTTTGPQTVTSVTTSPPGSSTTSSAVNTGSSTSSTGQPTQPSTPTGNYVTVFAVGAVVGVLFALLAGATRRSTQRRTYDYGPF